MNELIEALRNHPYALLSIYIIYLIFEFFVIWKRKGFTMTASPLTEQILFRASIRVPLISFLYFGFFSWGGHSPKFTADGFSHFIELGKLPLGLLSLSIPFVAVVNNIHRTIQTDAQIQEAKKKNLSDLFYSHKKNTIDYFSEKIKATIRVGNPKNNAQEEIELEIKDPYKLYKYLFPASTSTENNFNTSEDHKKKLITTWKRIDKLLSKASFAKRKNGTYLFFYHAKALHGVELGLRKIVKLLFLKEVRFKYSLTIDYPNSFELTTGIQNEEALKKLLLAFMTITNDIFLISNENLFEIKELKNINDFIHHEKDQFLIPSNLQSWNAKSVLVQHPHSKYIPIFKAI